MNKLQEFGVSSASKVYDFIMPGQYAGFVSKPLYLGDTGIDTTCFLQCCHIACALWSPCGHILFHI